MKLYSRTTGGFYDRDFHGEHIPLDAVEVAEDDYRALFVAQAAGKEILAGVDGYPIAATPIPATPAIPVSVSPAQARLALLAAGKLAQVEAIVAAADPATRIAWDNATYIERNSPTVAALSAALGLTSAQLDALFTAAAAIRV
jgi:hypothetical protein